MADRLRRELAAAAKSEYWGEADGRAAVAAWRESGESAARFGARHGFSARRLRWWARRLSASMTLQAGSGPGRAIDLIPIEVIQRAERVATIEITVGKFEVRIVRGVDPDALRTVVEVLRSC